MNYTTEQVMNMSKNEIKENQISILFELKEGFQFAYGKVSAEDVIADILLKNVWDDYTYFNEDTFEDECMKEICEGCGLPTGYELLPKELLREIERISELGIVYLQGEGNRLYLPLFHDLLTDTMYTKSQLVESLKERFPKLEIEIVSSIKKGNPHGYYDTAMGQYYPDDDVVKTNTEKATIYWGNILSEICEVPFYEKVSDKEAIFEVGEPEVLEIG